MTYDGRNPEPPYPTTEEFQAKHIEALEDQILDLGIERSRLAARVAELEAFIQENVECQCTPVRVCPRCAIATEP